jgi:serine protease
LLASPIKYAAAALLATLLPSLLALAATVPAADASDALVSRLVVRLRPAANAPLTDAKLSELQGALGQSVTGSTVTAAGNHVLQLASPVSANTAQQLVNALRMRGDVVWAEVERDIRVGHAAAQSAVAGSTETSSVRRLIVTFADPELAVASRNNGKIGAARDAELSSAAGIPLHVSRATVGGAWIVDLPAEVDMATARAIAAALQSSGVARLAAPDVRARPMASPDDAFFASGDQWYLKDKASTGYAGIDAAHAWDITTGSPSMVIAVVDTGILAHPDLAGRILAGYDFVSDVTSANDGNGRDADATDPGDWRTAGLCPAPFNTRDNSDWHGTMVAGVIAADTNNAIGVSGVDWNAQIVPARALGRCGGDFSDIMDAMTWAAGLKVPGVPVNPHPAKVINLSVGGEGPCDAQIQAILDEIVDAGVFIAVSAGNDNANADDHAPASCAGVSTVAATDQFGARTSYSNYSVSMDISAPGGDSARNGPNDVITTTWSSGTTVAQGSTYAAAEGTSFSAPLVAGVAALMLAVNPALTPSQLKALMAQTASPFAAGSDCVFLHICGAGIVNAFDAVKAAQATLGTPPVAQSVEYYNQSQDHYFMTAATNEIAALDNGSFVGWLRTGYAFNVYLTAAAGFNPVCRFYIPPGYGDSHFYSASPAECAIALSTYPFFVYESPNVFYVVLPDTLTGACPANMVPVYRVWDHRADTNHRYTTSSAIRATMVAAGWVAEGYGPDQVIMCAPK